MFKGPDRGYFAPEAAVDVNRKANVIYLLHGAAWTPGEGKAKVGELEIIYQDKTSEIIHVNSDESVSDWWYAGALPNGKVGWRSMNKLNVSIGIYVSRFRNPEPEKDIKRITLKSGDAVWGVIAVTLSDKDIEPMIDRVTTDYTPTGECNASVDVSSGEAVLENGILRIRYSRKNLGGSENCVITECILKTHNINQSAEQIDGVWIGYAVGRGTMTAGSVVYDGTDRKTLRLEWGKRKVVQEITIYPDKPVLKIDYMNYGVNIVDIGAPGGAVSGTYKIYGAEEWQAVRKKNTDPDLLNHSNEHHRLTYDLYPVYPHPLTDVPDWKGFAPAPMNYNGYLIFGVYNRENGVGFGRLMPFEVANCVKLLWNKGFEIFPYWKGHKRRFTGYLFTVTGGPDEIITLGKSIADGTFLNK
jgi:hypothetical protein